MSHLVFIHLSILAFFVLSDHDLGGIGIEINGGTQGTGQLAQVLRAIGLALGMGMELLLINWHH